MAAVQAGLHVSTSGTICGSTSTSKLLAGAGRTGIVVSGALMFPDTGRVNPNLDKLAFFCPLVLLYYLRTCEVLWWQFPCL